MQTVWALVSPHAECSPSRFIEAKAGALLDNTGDDVKTLLDLNNVSIVRVTRKTVKHMAVRKSGLIVNVGSLADGL